MTTLLLGSIILACLLLIIVFADEFIRSRVFFVNDEGGGRISSHSSSPLLKRAGIKSLLRVCLIICC
jgi:hypothetical protein